MAGTARASGIAGNRTGTDGIDAIATQGATLSGAALHKGKH